MPSSRSLVIMAAGMGHRFGGLKQLTAVGPFEATLMDYAIFDACRTGFQKVILIVRKETKDALNQRVVLRWHNKVDIVCVIQSPEKGTTGVECLKERDKPWGTGHALLCAETEVTDYFSIINADDFYGPSAFQTMSEALLRLSKTKKGDLRFAMVGYTLANTLSNHGRVARGVCRINADHTLKEIEERLNLERTSTGIINTRSDGTRESFTGDEYVSINFWGLSKGIFPHALRGFQKFLKTCCDHPNAEFFIPSLMHDLKTNHGAIIEVHPTLERWVGLTYAQDVAQTKQFLDTLISQGIYPRDLWNSDLTSTR